MLEKMILSGQITVAEMCQLHSELGIEVVIEDGKVTSVIWEERTNK